MRAAASGPASNHRPGVDGSERMPVRTSFLSISSTAFARVQATWLGNGAILRAPAPGPGQRGLLRRLAPAEPRLLVGGRVEMMMGVDQARRLRARAGRQRR